MDFPELSSPEWEDYELLDSGGGQKLERFGNYRFVRPDASALWKPTLSSKVWDSAHAVFRLDSASNSGSWQFRAPIEPRWEMRYKHLAFWAQPTPYRHMGVFPEQAAHWDWMQSLSAGQPVRVLNLFAYTGLASLACAAAGAQVTHVDAANSAILWGKANQALSGLDEKPIRWIVDDALKFTQREGRREAKYDALIMDPPPFGHGPRGEVWKFDKSMPLLLEACRALLSDTPLFVVITAYTAQTSPQRLAGDLQNLMSAHKKGKVTAGTAVTIERSSGRVLPQAWFARWQAR